MSCVVHIPDEIHNLVFCIVGAFLIKRIHEGQYRSTEKVVYFQLDQPAFGVSKRAALHALCCNLCKVCLLNSPTHAFALLLPSNWVF